MVRLIQNPEVSRPEPEPLGSSALDHARAAGNVAQIDSFGLRNNDGLWPSYNCLDTLVPTPTCVNPAAQPFFKTFDIAPWVPSFEFAVHAGVQCQAVGLDVDDQRSELERVFALNEGKGVERALLENRFVAYVPGSDEVGEGEWDAPVDLTPGSAITVQIALALLEGYAAAHYAGKPTIHMPRAAAVLLGEKIVWQGDLAFTRTGAKVAIGGGYDDPDVPMDGTWDLYATGEVYVEMSDKVSHQQYTLGDNSGLESDGNGLSANTVITLVERQFRVGVDCFTAKATATVWT